MALPHTSMGLPHTCGSGRFEELSNLILFTSIALRLSFMVVNGNFMGLYGFLWPCPTHLWVRPTLMGLGWVGGAVQPDPIYFYRVIPQLYGVSLCLYGVVWVLMALPHISMGPPHTCGSGLGLRSCPT